MRMTSSAYRIEKDRRLRKAPEEKLSFSQETSMGGHMG